MSALLESALAMGVAGWGVIPLHTPSDGACDCHRPDCSSPGKHPRTKNGLSDATTGADQIHKWWGMWGMWPQANIGAVVPDDCVVVDVDVANLATVFEADEMPPTASSRTGRGWHNIYRTPVPVRPMVGVRTHVDLRGQGSYIVVPPSLHVSGVTYEWVVPIANGIADAPAWVVEAAPSPRAGGDRPDDTDSGIPEGERNARFIDYRINGAANTVHARRVQTMWKPVLVYGSTTRRLHDVVRSGGADKAHHGWGQSESSMAALLRLVADPGQVICDPFLGGGTTAVVALAYGCSFIGAEVDRDAYEKSLVRVGGRVPENREADIANRLIGTGPKRLPAVEVA